MTRRRIRRWNTDMQLRIAWVRARVRAQGWRWVGGWWTGKREPR